jgi:branched-chain amino acid transport system substrate-binding protein
MSAGFAAEPVKIGLFAELTGVNAEFGREALQGAALALDEINRAGGVLGRPLALVSEDNQSTNPGSEVAVAKLLAADVKAIVTSPRSTQVLAVMPAIARAGVPTLACGTLYTLTHSNNPWIFRVSYHDGYLARAIADFGLNNLKKRRWAILHSEESYGIAGKNLLVQELKRLGVTPVLVQGSGYNMRNLTPVVEAVKNAAPDIVAMYFGPDNSAQLAKKLHEMGVGATVIGGWGITSKATLRIAGAALQGSYAVAPFAIEATPQSRAFSKRYLERAGMEPDQHAAWVYDAVHLVAQAIRTSGGTSAESIRQGLLAIRGHAGAAGSYTFDANGDGQHGISIVKNDGGKMNVVRYLSYSPN